VCDILVLAKRAAGVSIEQAAEDASRAAQRIWDAYPRPSRARSAQGPRRSTPEQVVAGS
jgi:hypothetical protein